MTEKTLNRQRVGRRLQPLVGLHGSLRIGRIIMYVLRLVAGMTIGFFGYSREVPRELDGMFAIVENGEYADGGHGPFLRSVARRTDGSERYYFSDIADAESALAAAV